MAKPSEAKHTYPSFVMADRDIVKLKRTLRTDEVLAANVCAEVSLLSDTVVEVADSFDEFTSNVEAEVRAKAVKAAYAGARLVEALSLYGPEWPADFTHPSAFVMGLDRVAAQFPQYEDVTVYG